jgi:predicted lipid-binding transport protein (Tim44 family)
VAPSPWYETGALLPATDRSALDRREPAALAAGLAAIGSSDPGFDADAFVAWATSVRSLATAAWRVVDPGPLKEVMAATLWEDYAGLVDLIAVAPFLRGQMSSATAVARLVAAHAGTGMETIVVAFDVTATVDARPLQWEEEWTFQRTKGTGWLVTRSATTMAGILRAHDVIAGQREAAGPGMPFSRPAPRP